MPLFEAKERTRTAPKRQGEGDFEFYDSSGRPEFQIYRDLVNGWIAELPEQDQPEMISRLQKSDSLGYQAALAELTIHAALRRQGYKVEVHPVCGHLTRKPDFLVRTAADEPVAYVEVTTFGPAQEDIAQDNRDAAIYNALDKAKLPAGHRLGLDVVKHGTKPPSLNKLVASVEKWAAETATDEPGAMPQRNFEIDDWNIELTLYGGFKKDIVPERVIASAMGDTRIVSAETEIREAVEKKGSRYGQLKAPYLVVVADCKGELTGGDRNTESLTDALFGTVVTVVQHDGAGNYTEPKDQRKNDGYWGTPDAPRHTGVSGLLLLPRPHLWDLRKDRWQPLVMHNPWAAQSLPDDLLPLPGYKVNAQNGFEPVQGRALADILGLPAVWPPAEE
jgi:hypothetical protein